MTFVINPLYFQSKFTLCTMTRCGRKPAELACELTREVQYVY